MHSFTSEYQTDGKDTKKKKHKTGLNAGLIMTLIEKSSLHGKKNLPWRNLTILNQKRNKDVYLRRPAGRLSTREI